MSLNVEVPYNQGAGLYLPLTGGALTGPLALGANKITGVANGTAATDAATFGQVQTTEAALNPALQYNDLLGWSYDVASPQVFYSSTIAAYVFHCLADALKMSLVPQPRQICQSMWAHPDLDASFAF